MIPKIHENFQARRYKVDINVDETYWIKTSLGAWMKNMVGWTIIWMNLVNE